MRLYLFIITTLLVNISSHAFNKYTFLGETEESIIINDTLRKESNTGNFDSFIEQFDLFNKNNLDESFFRVREQRKTEIHNPEITGSSFISCIKICNCEEEDYGLYYQPCYRIETEQFIMCAVNTACDIPTEGYPFVSDILITYDKNGNFIDYEIIGSSGDILYNKIEESKNFSELVYTQYSFFETNGYSGKCNVETFKVVISNTGTIDKKLLDSYTDDVTIEL